MANEPNNDTLNGKRVVFKPDAVAVHRLGKPTTADDADYNHGGNVVCQPGDEGVIMQGFDNWNGVEGLTIYYVRFDRGTHSHFSEREITLLD